MSNPFQRFWQRLTLSSNGATTMQGQTVAAPDANGKRRRPAQLVTKPQPYQTTVEIGNWKTAIMQAENQYRPRRAPLLRLYKEFMRDGHLRGQVSKLKNKVLAEPFVLVNDAGEEQPDALKLFNRPWFFDLLGVLLDTEFYGHSLIDFAYPNGEGEFERFDLIDRELVVPELGLLLFNENADIGIPYREVAAEDVRTLLEIGGTHDLGLLQHVGPDVIWKRYSRADWARRSERYGQPLTHLKTAETDAVALADKQRALATMGSSGYIITDVDDEIAFVEAKGDGHDVYADLAAFSNAEISIMLTGQTMTSDAAGGQVKGEVHERTEEHFVQAKMRGAYFFINYKLVPFLIGWGYKLDGLTWKWRKWMEEENERANGGTETDPAQADQPDEVDPEAPSTDPKAPRGSKPNTKPGETKQAPKPAVAKPPASKLTAPTSLTLAAATPTEPPPADLTARVQALMARMYQEREDSMTDWLRTPEWQAVQQYVGEHLYGGVEEGYGQQLVSLDSTTPDAKLLSQLRANTYVFSAYRNFNLLTQLNALLPAADGQGVRPWPEFRREALALHEDYNGSWLEAEYQTAIATAQSAAKWQSYQDGGEDYLLKISTVNDDRVRLDHRQLDGIMLPVDHEFWHTHWPPFGWKCRCTVVRVPAEGREPTDLSTREVPVLPKMFSGNAGRTGVVFGNSHRYFDVSGKEVNVAIKAAGEPPALPRTEQE